MSKRLKTTVSVILVLVAIFVAVPKVYFHQLLGHDHKIESPDLKKSVGDKLKDNSDDCDLDKFETPVYFTIFKFILNCNPFKKPEKLTHVEKQLNIRNHSVIYPSLRAPPATV